VKTPSFTGQQGIFSPASDGGMGVKDTRTFAGAYGDGIQVFDIEYAWNRNHEDVRRNFPPTVGQPDFSQPRDIDHGTSVAGIVKADKNSFGVEGVAPNVTFHTVAQTVRLPGFTPPSTTVLNTWFAIFVAAAQANPGDVLLLEAQRPWTPVQSAPLLPIEWWPQDFIIIQWATSVRGVIVVEAAGNSGFNLDSPILNQTRYQRREFIPFDQSEFGFYDLVRSYPSPFIPGG